MEFTQNEGVFLRKIERLKKAEFIFIEKMG